MRHQLKRLALIPKNLRRFGHRRLGHARNDVALLNRHWPGRRNDCLVFVAEDNPANLRLQIRLVLHELFLQMRPRKFQRNKLVMIARLT